MRAFDKHVVQDPSLFVSLRQRRHTIRFADLGSDNTLSCVVGRNCLRKSLLAMLVSGQVENLWLDRVGRAGHVWRVVVNRCAAQRANHHGTRLPQPWRNRTIS